MEVRHDYRTRTQAAFIAHVLERLSPANSATAKAYFDHQTAKGNVLSSLVNTGSYLLHLDSINNGARFKSLRPDDLTRTIVEYGRTRRPTSTHRFTVYLKALYKWLHGGELPAKYRHVLTHKRPKTLPKRVLSEDDFRTLLLHAWGKNRGGWGWMRQALLWVLWDSGFRISEALSLRVGSVTLLEDGAARIEIPTDAPHLKTGPRTIDVAECVPALKLWLERHPARDNRDPTWTRGAPLFPSSHEPDAAIEPTTVNRVLGGWCRKAGFSRIVTVHVFRHTRATRAAKAGWSSWEMEPYFGWVGGSKESATYVHMVSADVAHKVRAAANVDPLGAKLRQDPTKAFQEAVAQASANTAEIVATRLLEGLGFRKPPAPSAEGADDGDSDAAPAPVLRR